MRYLYENKKFVARQNKRVNIFPKIDGVDMQTYIDEAYGHWFTNGCTGYFGFIEKDPFAGICEVVYGVRWNLKEKRNIIQKLLVIPEGNRVPLIRNCYYRWGGMGQGFHSYGYDGKGKKFGSSYYGDLPYSLDFDYLEPNFPLEKVYLDEHYITAEAIAAIDPSLKYNNFNLLGSIDLTAIEYIRLYRKHPTICEMLMKMGLSRFLNEKTIKMLEDNRDFAFWLARNARDIASTRMAPRTAFNAYKKNPSGDPMDYAHSLECRCAVGREIAFANKKVYRKAIKYATQERILRYQEEQNISSQSYGDYLTACDWLKLDFSDTKVLFPHNFREMHDLYTAQYFEWVAAQEKEKAKKEAAALNIKMRKTAEKFAFLGQFSEDGICVFVAKTKSELIDEGAALHHCVGRMDYDKRQARGESVICFIRKADQPFVPYVTAEVRITDQQLRISQCYGDGDRAVPELAGFTAAWMKAANKEYKKREKSA